MTDIVEQQVKTLLTRFKNEIANASSNAQKAGNGMANALTPARTQMEHLLITTQRLAKDGA